MLPKNAKDPGSSVNSKSDGNTTTFNAARALEAFAPFVHGPETSTLAIISEHPLTADAQTALESTADRLRFGKNGILWVQLNAGSSGENAESALTSEDLRELLISTDPLAIICADAASCRALGAAFDVACKPDNADRVWCRTVVGFNSFERMLQHPQDKQRAWHLLKQL